MIIKVASVELADEGMYAHMAFTVLMESPHLRVECSSNCFKALVCTLNSILRIRFQSNTFLCWSLANILYFAGCFCYRSSTIPLMSQLSID